MAFANADGWTGKGKIMSIEIVTDIIDISNWQKDDTYNNIYPFGSRVKGSIFSPVAPEQSFIKPAHRYLFKESREHFPWQFWMEIIAYHIGNLMQIDVPPAYVGYDHNSHKYAALIEWFYNDKQKTHTHGGDILEALLPDYDRVKGAQHNWQLVYQWVSSEPINLTTKGCSHWAKLLVFDAFIGNTYRHQDNWGIVKTAENKIEKFSPAFDNGTSMGYEILEEKLSDFDAETKLLNYIQKGTHHMKWSLEDTHKLSHVEMVQKFIKEYPFTKEIISNCLNFELSSIQEILQKISSINISIPLTNPRINFMLRLFEKRYNQLKRIVSEN